MLITIDKIFEKLKIQEQYHHAICIALRQCLTDPELNIILHDDIGHDVDRLLLEHWTIYNSPTSYDTEPMDKMSTIKRKKKHNGSIKTTRTKRSPHRSRSRQN